MMYAAGLAIMVIIFLAGRLVGKAINRRDQKKHNMISSEIKKIMNTEFTGHVSPHRDISIANELILLLRDHK